jgi:hypothetical protein
MAGPTTAAFTAAGTIISVSAALPASVTKTGYGALTWVTVGEVTDGGEIGRVYNIVTHNPLATRGTVNLKGSFNDGTIAIKAAYASGDAGQVLVQAALLLDVPYSFKFALQDGTVIYCEAQVASAPVSIGTVDNVTGVSFNLAVKSGTVIFAPAA